MLGWLTQIIASLIAITQLFNKNKTLVKQFIRLSGILFFAVLLTNCKNQNSNVSIEGKLKIPAETNIWLGNMDVDKVIAQDSSSTNAQGEFSLNIQVDVPSLYQLNVGNMPIYLVIKPGDNISIAIDNSISVTSYYVEGSTESRLVQNVVTTQERVLDQITKISLEYEEIKLDPESFSSKKEKLDQSYNELLSNHKSYTEKLIYDNPKSLACIFALYQNFGKTNQALFHKFDDFTIFNFVDSTLSLTYPNTPAVQALNRDVASIRDQIKFKTFSDNLTEPGRKSPEFEIQTLNGNFITLRDFKDKPVVYFFFAVWNKSSVKEALALNELYKKNHYRGLKVIGVSFDSSKDKLQEFIDKHEIAFPIACDYLYWDSKYVMQFGVKKVPDLILLNPNHIIEQRNISTSELTLILKEWRTSEIF